MRQVTKEVLSDFVDSMQSKDLLTSVIGAVRCDAMRCDAMRQPLSLLGPYLRSYLSPYLGPSPSWPIRRPLVNPVILAHPYLKQQNLSNHPCLPIVL